MEFRFRAGDEKNQPPAPSPAVSNAGRDGSQMDARPPRQSPPPTVLVGASLTMGECSQSRLPAALFPSSQAIRVAGADHELQMTRAEAELQRQLKKERIKEEILRQEAAERQALEAEVRQELAMERLLGLRHGSMRLESPTLQPLGALGLRYGVPSSSRWSETAHVDATNVRVLLNLGSSLQSEGGYFETAAAAGGKPETRSVESPRLVEPMQVKPPAQTASGSKRKKPDATPTISGTTSSKKQKLEKHEWSCAVCCITTTSEKGMEEHRKGKSHKKAVLARTSEQTSAAAASTEQQEKDECLITVASYTPRKLVMQTRDGTMHDVLQMEGYLLCEPCNVRTADRVTMMCHLQGGKHSSKAKRLHQARKEPEATAVALSSEHVIDADNDSATESKEERAVPVTMSVRAPKTIAMEVAGMTHAVLQMQGYLLCDRCNVQANHECMMRSHLSGKKHKTKTKGAVTYVGAQAKMVMSMEGTRKTDNAATKTVTIHVEDDESIMRSQVSAEKHKNDTSATAATDIGAQGKKELSVALAEVTAMAVASTDAAMSVDETTRTDDVTAKTATIQVEGDEFMTALAKKEMAVPLALAQAKATDVASTDADMSVEETAKMGDIAAKTIKMQIEGAVHAVLEQASGGLFCEPCGAHCHDKYSMVLHLYTSVHRDKVRAQEQKQVAMTVEAMAVNNAGDVAVTKGMA